MSFNFCSSTRFGRNLGCHWQNPYVGSAKPRLEDTDVRCGWKQCGVHYCFVITKYTYNSIKYICLILCIYAVSVRKQVSVLIA